MLISGPLTGTGSLSGMSSASWSKNDGADVVVVVVVVVVFVVVVDVVVVLVVAVVSRLFSSSPILMNTNATLFKTINVRM